MIGETSRRREKGWWRKFCEWFTSRTVDDADMAEISGHIDKKTKDLAKEETAAKEETVNNLHWALDAKIKSVEDILKKVDEKIQPDTMWQVKYTATFGEDGTRVKDVLSKIVDDALGDIKKGMEEEWQKASGVVENLERHSNRLSVLDEKLDDSENDRKRLSGECARLEQKLEAEKLAFEQCRGELDAEKGNVEALNEELEKVRKELDEAGRRHEEEKARIEAENEKTRKELTEEHAKAIGGLRQAKDAEIAGLVAERDGIAEKVKSQIEEMLPKRYCDLFGVEFGTAGDDGMMEARVQCLFAYLILLKSNLRGAVQFANRFQQFDRVVWESLCDEPETLEEVREKVEKDVRVWAGKAGFEVSWAKEGDAFDSNMHKTTGTMGQTVEKAVTATVWQTDGNGVRKCIAKGEVETR